MFLVEAENYLPTDGYDLQQESYKSTQVARSVPPAFLVNRAIIRAALVGACA